MHCYQDRIEVNALSKKNITTITIHVCNPNCYFSRRNNNYIYGSLYILGRGYILILNMHYKFNIQQEICVRRIIHI